MSEARPIRSPEAYQRALERIETLKAEGETSDTSRELAELEAATAEYAARNNEPAERKASPPNKMKRRPKGGEGG